MPAKRSSFRLRVTLRGPTAGYFVATDYFTPQFNADTVYKFQPHTIATTTEVSRA
jgi:hypothetical protein